GITVFSNLGDSVYRIVARRDGFAPAVAEYLRPVSPSESVTLRLEPGMDRVLYFENPETERKAAMLLRQGLEAYQKNDLPGAEELIRQAIDLNPDAVDALYYYGVITLAQAKFDQAAEAMRRAAEVAEIMKSVPSPMREVYTKIAQTSREQLDQIPIIRADYTLREENFDEAIRLFEEILKVNPEQADVHARLSIALTQVDRLDDAAAAVERAIKLAPEEEGFKALKEQIRITRENKALQRAQSLLDEGTKLMKADNNAGALVKLEEALKLTPQDKQAPIWRQKGRALAALKRADEAESAFKKAIELASPKDSYEYRMSFAQFYLDSEQFEKAVDVMADSAAVGDRDPEKVLLELAESTRNREYRLAEAALERVIKINPDNANAHYDLGRLYFARGGAMDARARELLTRYRKIGTDQNKKEDAEGLIFVINRRSK
ncbi:MAG TPA: tetratricopeptide repeat protein, partial [Acidobacteriota bacterium]|nr:tetratricopeptide repeat protein [Acidobacteriota bacterium]